MTLLSVNINKVATLRNARGGNVPNVLKVASDCERFGAEGITVHPRPDARHITFDDVHALAEQTVTEFNVEGYPSPSFIDLVTTVKPHQVTLVPDPPEALTSNNGWDTIANKDLLSDVIQTIKTQGIRTSVFVNPDASMVEGAVATGADRIELYTESYADQYSSNREDAIRSFVEAAQTANEVGIGVNAGHDLSLENLGYFAQQIPNLLEVSIGHALISDALYLGLENTIRMYKAKLG